MFDDKPILKDIPVEWPLFLSATFLAFIFVLALTRKLMEPSIKARKEEVASQRSKLDQISLNIHQLFDGKMLGLSQAFAFESATKARLSLYINDEDEERFVPCGRYSPDPTLKRKGRTSFPHREGCIWKAWENGYHFDNAIPNDTDGNFSAYQNKHYDVPIGTSRSLKMRPALIAGHRIPGQNGDVLGVVIFEALDSNGFANVSVKPLLEDASQDLSIMVQALWDYIPKPSDAEEAGL